MKSFTRRQFISRTAVAGGALAFPYVIPATALGRDGAVAPSERLVMGAIGIGGRGEAMLGWLLGERDVQVVAVCDVQKDRREKAKGQVDGRYGNGDCAVYRDFRDLLAQREDVDAVLIATGDRWHAHASVHAMKAGKDVYCEKPACLTMAQGQAVRETARTYGRVFQTGAQRLSEPNHVFAFEMARSGRLGKIDTVYADCRWRGGYRFDWLPAEPLPERDEVDWDLWLGPSPWRPFNRGYLSSSHWYNFHDLATDVAMWGSHTIAQCLAGIRLPEDRTVDIVYDPSPSADLSVRFADGLKMVLFRGFGGAPCPYWHGSCGERFDGSEGWVAAADGYAKPDVSSPAMLAEFRRILGEYEIRTRRPLNHVRDFLDCVRSRRPTVASTDIMYDSMILCLAADICTRLKRDVKLDLAKGEFIDDPEANRMRVRASREPWQI